MFCDANKREKKRLTKQQPIIYLNKTISHSVIYLLLLNRQHLNKKIVGEKKKSCWIPNIDSSINVSNHFINHLFI